MEKKTALAVAGGLVLMVAGAMSAFAMTLGAQTSTGGGAGAEADTVVVTQYVDEFGNPIAGPEDVAAPDQQLVVVELGADATETFVVAADPGAFTFDVSFGGDVSVSDDWDDDSDDEWDDDHDDDDHDDDHGNDDDDDDDPDDDD
jgi:hypothetical protein